MVNNISSALNAYQQALSRIGAKVPVEEPKNSSTINNEFQNMVKNAVEDAVEISKNRLFPSYQVVSALPDHTEPVLNSHLIASVSS